MKLFLLLRRRKPSEGFTLIELMVVIAIVGVLSSVVLVSLSVSRSKASNAAIKANLNNMRGQALIFYESNGFNYSPSGPGLCNKNGSVLNDPKIQEILLSLNGITGSSLLTYCKVNSSAWVVTTQLSTVENGFSWWCVDETGVSRGITASQYNIFRNFSPSQYWCP